MTKNVWSNEYCINGKEWWLTTSCCCTLLVFPVIVMTAANSYSINIYKNEWLKWMNEWISDNETLMKAQKRTEKKNQFGPYSHICTDRMFVATRKHHHRGKVSKNCFIIKAIMLHIGHWTHFISFLYHNIVTGSLVSESVRPWNSMCEMC